MTVRVTADGTPFWLVLGQSHNAGWSAHVRGGGVKGTRSLGPPVLVDGFANGWAVPAGLRGPLTVTLDWTPQHTVDLALLLSAAALLLCLALAVWPRRRSVPPVATDHLSLPARPEVWNVSLPSGRPLVRRQGVGVLIAVSAATLMVAGPVVAVVVAGAAVVVLLRPRARGLLTVGSMVLFGVCVLYVLQLQFRYRFPPKIEWPQHFDRIALVPWVVLAFVVTDALSEHLRAIRIRRRRAPPGGGP